MICGGGTDIKWTTDDIDLTLAGESSTTLTLTAPATGYAPAGYYDEINYASNSMGILEKLQLLNDDYRIAYYNTTTTNATYKATVHTAWTKE